jgi:hypothetical protein
MDGPSPPIKLCCLDGEAAPPELAGDLRRVLDLPAEALRRFWHVLGPSLGEPLPREAEPLLDGYCRAYHLDERALAHAVKACRFLLREAARRDLPRADFAADVAALAPDAPVLADVLLAGYEKARVEVRRELLGKALSAHGNLLVGLDWRVDTVESSDRGARLKAPVALLTLRYQEGSEARRLTLQVLPDMLAELEDTCRRIRS